MPNYITDDLEIFTNDEILMKKIIVKNKFFFKRAVFVGAIWMIAD